jgi:hypothetical protein
VGGTRRGRIDALTADPSTTRRERAPCGDTGSDGRFCAIARGRAWFEELATCRARSLQDLANRDGITRRYIRRLVGLAFLSPQLVEAILQGRQPVALALARAVGARPL